MIRWRDFVTACLFGAANGTALVSGEPIIAGICLSGGLWVLMTMERAALSTEGSSHD